MLNCIGKIFTAIFCRRINDWEEVRYILSEEQFSFRRTTDCLYIVNTLIETSVAEIFHCYVDLKKVFDSVNHNLLREKLKVLVSAIKCLK